mmetsp:Transcript_42685/g.71232  ORF Transcript_42685/g.71232 Transcript_42685/m.71232 type:complete len:84 (+) Transcript_42685:149-400(+)
MGSSILQEMGVELLHDAALRGRVDLLEQVLDKGGEVFVDAPNEYGLTALMLSAMGAKIHCVSTLLSKGASAKAMDKVEPVIST